jgi:pyruvate dehydrogenase E1 component alpha subunit
MSDPGKYRTPEELEDHKKRDALLRSRAELVEMGHQAAVEKADAEVEEVIADALRFAEESPEPGPEILEETTYKGAFAR